MEAHDDPWHIRNHNWPICEKEDETTMLLVFPDSVVKLFVLVSGVAELHVKLTFCIETMFIIIIFVIISFIMKCIIIMCKMNLNNKLDNNAGIYVSAVS